MVIIFLFKFFFNVDKVFNVYYVWLIIKGNFNISKLVRNEI